MSWARPLRSAIDEYVGRVRRYVTCDEIELKDEPLPKLREALVRATAGANVVAMEVGGRVLDSPAFAHGVERLGSRIRLSLSRGKVTSPFATESFHFHGDLFRRSHIGFQDRLHLLEGITRQFGRVGGNAVAGNE